MPEGPHHFGYLKDLRRDRVVKVGCRQCRHRGEVSTARILRMSTGYMPLIQLKRHFRCLECDEKGNVYLDAEDALSQ